MFKRPHHQRISYLLNKVNAPLFSEIGCYFGGGTAICLLLGEYRESVDIDFLCSKNSFNNMRQLAYTGVQSYFKDQIIIFREPHIDQYGIRFFVDTQEGNPPIKVEIVHEGYLPILKPEDLTICGLQTLHHEDLMACKIMSTSDRGLDKATKSRDLIDLLMLSSVYGGIPENVISKVETNYGSFASRLIQAKKLLENEVYCTLCFQDLDLSEQTRVLVKNLIKKEDADFFTSLRSGSFSI